MPDRMYFFNKRERRAAVPALRQMAAAQGEVLMFHVSLNSEDPDEVLVARIHQDGHIEAVNQSLLDDLPE